jgi:hypothetical protein
MVTRFEPAPKLETSCIGSIGTREPAGGKAEPLCFRSYCFLKAFVVSHG